MEEMSSSALLEKWSLRIKRAQLAHRFAAKGYAHLHLWLGVPAIGLSALVATSVFASLQDKLGAYGWIITGMLSVGATILVALQTFLRFEELSSKHQAADARYGAIRQNIEQLQAFSEEDQASMANACDRIRLAMENLMEEIPMVPERYWQQARAVLDHDK
jgi:hypothetical protein